MWSTLVLLHSEEKSRLMEEIPNFISWHTCMRSVYLSDKRLLSVDSEELISKKYEIYFGFEAYTFLLEIVCGLHSKLFGESEIQGQFRDRFKESQLNNTSLSLMLQKLRDQILEHSKIVRTTFLTGFGRQSYGSLCEKFLIGSSHIHLFGTGNLAKSLIPYLLDHHRTVVLYGRNKARLSELRQEFKVQTGQWENYISDFHPVIIASSYYSEYMMQKHQAASVVLDFRENTISEIGKKKSNYIPFSQILATIQNTEIKIDLLKPKVRSLIFELTQNREDEQTHFINGWEDLPQVCY
ncbi:glutamyl-tRNA reductase [Leptospira ognonensis]|uniref:Glutamyl-tRNA reductase n=2 Tax=Leptospira ognonensis TaxID=2484945 RepID=A0A4R9JWC6_9LEPT|nr:glutamyl-tRNA reductase [Leptospira ognonensis]TGL56641.1 glutamyl-tRNA reductase [Leptospira ognonensis]